MKLLDPNDPFFAQPWRRWATSLLPIVWGGVEFAYHSPGWGLMFVTAGAYAFYILIWKARPGNKG